MNTSLAVLLIEDSEQDAFFILQELRRAYPDVACRRVETLDELETAYDERRWDLVISDYNMPRFSMQSAMAFFRRKDADLPFIIVSGIIGEERAVEAMRAGAQDYVMKNRLSRLLPVVERELNAARRHAEHRKVREKLDRSEKRFKDLVELLPEMIIETDKKGNITFANNVVYETFGYSPDDIRDGLNIAQLIGEADGERFTGTIDHFYDGNTGSSAEYTGIRKDGGSFPVIVHVNVILNQRGEPTGLRGVILNITERKQAEETIEGSLALLRATFNSTADGILVIDHKKNTQFFNRRLIDLLGIPEQVAATLNNSGAITRLITEQLEDPRHFTERMEQVHLRSCATACDVLRFKDGRTIELYSQPQRIGDRDIGRVWSFHDITEREHSQRALRESEERFRAVFDNGIAGTSITNRQGRIVEANLSLLNMVGYTNAEIIAMEDFRRLVHPDDVEKDSALFRELAGGKRGLYEIEQRFRRKDGTIGWGHLMVFRISSNEEDDYFAVRMIEDVTRRRETEEKVRASLREKEVLLKEIHHRVKNNLQLISSMLNLQSHCCDDREALEMLRESRNRVKSMAIIHEKLYQAKDLGNVDFAPYIESLAANLFRSYVVTPGRVAFSTKIEAVSLGIDTAIPCGLIVNELVSNALKHAFHKKESGEIRIELSNERPASGKKRYLLVVRDNGDGFPEEIDFRSTQSLGMQLVTTLVEQLGGTIELSRGNGTGFTITFEDN